MLFIRYVMQRKNDGSIRGSLKFMGNIKKSLKMNCEYYFCFISLTMKYKKIRATNFLHFLKTHSAVSWRLLKMSFYK